MAKKTGAKAKKSAEPEFEPKSRAAKARMEAGEDRDYTVYADKEPTDLQERMGLWVLEKTGIEVEDEAAFLEGVRLGVALRMEFQASPENQQVLADRRAAREAGEDEEEETPKPKKAKAKRAKAVVEEPDDDDEDEDDEDDEEEEPAPKPKARKTAKKAAAAPKPTATRKARKTSKAKPADDDVAPY